MSGSLPRIRPPGSAALKLCPMPPSPRAQSPDKSGTFEAGSGDGGPSGRKFFCARSAADGVICVCAPANNGIAAMAMVTAKRTRLRMPLPRSWLLTRGWTGGGEFLPIGQHDLLQVADSGAVLRGEDVNGNLIAFLQRASGPSAFQHHGSRLGRCDPVLDLAGLIVFDIEEDLIVRSAPLELRDRPLQHDRFRCVKEVGAMVGPYDGAGNQNSDGEERPDEIIAPHLRFLQIKIPYRL